MPDRSLESMKAAIGRGESVLYKGRVISTLSGLPKEAELAAGNPRLEAQARANLESQIAGLLGQLTTLNAQSAGPDEPAATPVAGDLGGDIQTPLNFPPTHGAVTIDPVARAQASAADQEEAAKAAQAELDAQMAEAEKQRKAAEAAGRKGAGRQQVQQNGQPIPAEDENK